MKQKRKIIILIGILFLISIAGIAILPGCAPVAPPNATNISLGQAIYLSQNNQVKDVRVESENGWMLMTARIEGDPLVLQGESSGSIEIRNNMQLLADIGVMTSADLQQLGFVFPPDFSVSRAAGGSGISLFSFLPFIFLGLLLFWFLRMGSRASARNQVGDLGRSKAKIQTGDTPLVTFSDVAGVPEAKEDLHEIVDFLKNRGKFLRIGARIPKGVLLAGPPGTGKTLLAKAIAGEAGVPFFSISGSEFVEIFVGVGASRVRDLFAQAKAKSPSIIFIDEIDAVGRRRSVGPGASHEEREQTLNQILSEMDGFTPNSGVIVLAATNRPDVLDPALLRPGRFDRRVMLDLPDSVGRQQILLIHTKGKPLDDSVDLEVVGKQTHGFSGAELANLINEAAIMAARRDKASIGIDEINEAFDRVIAGPSKKSRKVNLQDKKRTAYHEGGHALVGHLLPNADPVFKVSIVARGGIGGYTRTLPAEERYLLTKPQLQDNLATLLAGHVAEETIFNNVSTGPHNDIRRATDLARQMVLNYGMSDNLPLRTFGGDESREYGFDQRDYSEEMAKKIDDEVHILIEDAHRIARNILKENKSRLIHLADKLIEVENLEGPELEQAFTEPLKEEEAKKPESIRQETPIPIPGV